MGEYNYNEIAGRTLFCLRYDGIPDEYKVYEYVVQYLDGKHSSHIPRGFMDWLKHQDHDLYQRVNAFLVARKLTN
jgi:hypothetical protein